MNCEACTDRLIELLYEELDDSDRESLLGHIGGCEPCQAAFDRLRSGFELAAFLPLEEPPAGLLSEVLAMARQKANERAPAKAEAPAEERTAQPRDDAEPDATLWGTVLHWVGGFAMRPQLAMAMTLLLMVGIGLWYLPEMRGSDPADTHAIVDPTPGDEVGPSATLEPAEPLDLMADPRSGRILPRGTAAETPAAVTVAETVEGEEADEGEPPSEALAGSNRAPEDRAEAEPLLDPPEHPALAAAQMEIGEDALGDTQPPPPMPTSPPVHAPAVALAPRVPSQNATTPAPVVGPEPEAPADQPRNAQAQYERGLARYRQRDYRGAATDFDAVVRRPDTDPRLLMPTALHQLARSHRSSGNCAAALRAYERLLGRHPRYGGAPEAMIEAGQCHERLGNLSAARRMYTQAQTHSGVASRARQQMTALAARERAHDRARTNVGAGAPEADSPDQPTGRPSSY